eukprot:CAMPEP_0119340276 /NCGR_PEP_ID=MMETSP1333-20130426/99999_1 /TAXON_ID=418940 /ORGANISM="Scyphosphaera apsteinii, Strain RCC1455" /LENGTH=914 /DNA_ID=CAMNT_0007351993 /DNA_START=40 /DNA_END=2784 /DNA_ORIENTATION=+
MQSSPMGWTCLGVPLRRLLPAFDVLLVLIIAYYVLAPVRPGPVSSGMIPPQQARAPQFLPTDKGSRPWALGTLQQVTHQSPSGSAEGMAGRTLAATSNTSAADVPPQGKHRMKGTRHKGKQGKKGKWGKKRRDLRKEKRRDDEAERHSDEHVVGKDDAQQEVKPAAERKMEHAAKQAPPAPVCGKALQTFKCTDKPHKAVVTLSVGTRAHFAVIRVPMQAYADRVGAEFHVVNSMAHPSLKDWNHNQFDAKNSHFIKLPMLKWFLHRFQQVLFLDDDVLISPNAPNLFEQVACQKVGAVVEAYHAQGWHTMHARSLCEIYQLRGSFPESCSPAALKRQRIFNSGLMLLSDVHRPLLDKWDEERLECRILCDQLYLNAMLRKHKVCLQDLGTAFNLPGTQVRKQLMMSTKEAASDALEIMDSPLAQACAVHLTVLPSKPHTSHYLLKRALEHHDVMQCAGTGESSHDDLTMLKLLPDLSYDINKIWCQGMAADCIVIAPSGGAARSALEVQSLPKPLPTKVEPEGRHESAEVSAAPSLSRAPINATPSAELPASALTAVQRAAAYSWDMRTVILIFATKDFMDLAINWAQAARVMKILNFVLVAMDRKLGEILARFDEAPGLLLPRVASGAVWIDKLNVIGERQRFGLRVLEAGFNVLFADLDAIILKSPEPLLRDGDIIGERIWGRPLSVVKKWGAAICTGFYFIRSTPQTISIFRRTHFLIAEKRKRQKKWQASDQWAINHAVDDQVVEWEKEEIMKPITDSTTKFHDNTSHVGFTKLHRSKFVVLPHVYVARSCPILKYGTTKPPADDKSEMKKWTIWQFLLRTSYVLHCFPPDAMPCPKLKHGEKGCDKSIIMGSAVHIHGEVVFDKRQGLWFMADDWETSIAKPSTRDFFLWLRSQHNGLRPGQSPPDKS